MSETVVRHLEARDVVQIQAIYSEPGAYGNTLQVPYQSAEHWEKKLAREGLTSLVAVRGDDVLGHLSVEVFRHPRRRHVATLGMGVKAAARGTGVGSVLLNAAIDLCDNWLDVSRIELEVYTDNDAGLALYSRCGFEIEGTCKRYAFRDGRYVDVHIMARIKQGQVRDLDE
jgi:putative acetyltransferase